MATAPQQVANPYDDPQTSAVYDQMRQTVSPKEFGDEVLAGASQVDPQAVAQFRDDLSQINLPPEALDLLNNMVDEILANPQQYAEIRAKYIEMGAPEELLPEQFDPGFFAAMNMAVDQMVGAPAGEQAFAKGGIAELTPVSKAIADYGRNGDTMLAHITPAEARMLRRKGGSGSINPDTGLPEFFNLFKSIGKAFKAVGNAVKSFASSTVGRIVTTVALGFFLGPAAASAMGVTSAAGVAAVSGFVGSAGATLAGGGNLSQALKAGAVGGLTAGATAGITGTNAFQSGSYSGAGLTPTEAFQGQVDKFSNMVNPVSAPAAPTINPNGSTTLQAPVQSPVGADFGNQLNMANPDYAPVGNAGAGAPGTSMMGSNPAQQFDTSSLPSSPAGSVAPPATAGAPAGDKSWMDSAKDFYNKNISPSGIKEAGMPAAQDAGAKAVTDLVARMPDATPAMKEAAYQKAVSAASPGILATYGPATALGIGAIGAFGGFQPRSASESSMKKTLMGGPGSAQDLLKNNPYQYYIQNLPGVQYYGGSVLPPTGMAAGGEVRHFVKGGITDEQIAAWWADPKNQGKSDAEIKTLMDELDIKPTDFSRAIGANAETAKNIEDRYAAVVPETYSSEDSYLYNNLPVTPPVTPPTSGEPPVTPPETYSSEDSYLYNNLPVTPPVTPPVDAGAPARSERDQALFDLFVKNQNNFNLGQFKTELDKLGYTPEDVSRVTGTPLAEVKKQYEIAVSAPTTPYTGYVPPVTGGTTVAPPAGGTTVTPPGTVAPPTKVTPPATVIDPTTGKPVTPVTPVTATSPTGGNVASTKGVTVASPTLRGTVAPTDELSKEIQSAFVGFGTNPSETDMQKYMDKEKLDPRQVAIGLNIGLPEVQARYYTAKNAAILNAPAPEVTTKQLYNTGADYSKLLPPGQTLGTVPAAAAPAAPVGGLASLMPAAATPGSQNLPNLPQNTTALEQLAARDARAQKDYLFAMGDKKAAFMNMGGIAGLAQGGYPRRTGQIEGPGTETSDSIPAMLSDGEFVMTAKAVRGAGKGDRRAGAKRMYALMNQLEKNAARG